MENAGNGRKLEYLTVKELADIIGWTPNGLCKQIREGKISHDRIFRNIIIRKEDIKKSFSKDLSEEIISIAKERGIFS